MSCVFASFHRKQTNQLGILLTLCTTTVITICKMRLLGVLVALSTASELFQPDAMATAMDQARTGDLVYLMKDLVSEKYYEEYFRIVGKGRASVNLENFKSFYLNQINMCPFDERLKRTLSYSLSGFFDELEYTRHDKRYNMYSY